MKTKGGINMIYAILITIALILVGRACLKRDREIAQATAKAERAAYLEELVHKHYEEKRRMAFEAAVQAAECAEAKRVEKQRKAENARELAQFELEHRETLRGSFNRQYDELVEEIGNASDKRRPVLQRKLEALEERRFKNDLAIAKLYNKARG